MPPEPPGGLPALRLAVRGERRLTPGTTAEQSTKEFGANLFRALFNDKALAILRTSQYVSAKRQRGLRLRIRFADATQLANLPWELLYDPERHWYPCQLSRFPTLRFVDLPEPVLPLRVTGPLRMLVVISSPTDLPALEVEREWTLLRTELDPLVQSGRLELKRLPSATLDDVRETLMHQDFHIFHYIGHGGVDPETGEGHLAFTGPDGRQRRVSGSQLGVMLSNAPIRLAVLNSCEGGRVSDVDPYASTAIALVEQGIPAVVAMQFQITDAAATAFSRTLYDSVTAGRPVDLSVTLARQAVLAVSESEWATPVLYLRAVDGVLFDLEARDEPAATITAETAALGPRAHASRAPEPAAPSPHTPEPRAPAPPAPQPPAQPQHLRAEVVDGVVNLVWQQPPDHALPVRAWEVWRNGVRHAIVSFPMAFDDTPGAGEYQYTVVALGEGDARSVWSRTCTVHVTKPVRKPVPPATPPRVAPSRPAGHRAAAHGSGGAPPSGTRAAAHGPAEEEPLVFGQPARRKSRKGWVLLLLVAAAAAAFGLWWVFRPTPVDTVATTPPTSETKGGGGGVVTPAPKRADLKASVLNAGFPDGAGDLMDVVFEVTNGGPNVSRTVIIDVTVESDDATALREAAVQLPGAGETRTCPIGGTGNAATCEVGDLAENDVATVTVRVSSLTAFRADITAHSATTDKDKTNNHTNQRFSPETPNPGPS
ncbi:MAG TPA: CHAT domain-containing protein [Humibacillus sp.]|nr:CHAT domain-containing protein [Humibacillus sp.]